MKSFVFLAFAAASFGVVAAAPRPEGGVAQADALLGREPPPYKLDAIGKRLRSPIGENIATLADAYAATKDRKYLDGAVRYMRAAAAYSDWKPSYYLTCAGVMNGFSRALEVCGKDMDADVRAELQDVLLDKGLKGSFLGWWWWSKNNWTQVCCYAVAYAALQIRDRHPRRAESYLRDAINGTKSAMEAYAPDGCYTEGPSYWHYATENTEKMIAVLRRCNGGDDGGISAMPGYEASKRWIADLRGPTGRVFCFADGSPVPDEPRAWGVTNVSVRVHRGVQPTGVLMSPTMWVAVKGGRARVNHAHMDAGCFVLETVRGGRPVRWVEDLGTEKYSLMEKAGLDVWNTRQSSKRWRVFRQGVQAHAVLTVDGGDFNVSGDVPLAADGSDAIVADLTELCGEWKKATRRWRLTEGGLTLTDEIEGAKEGHSAVFNFLTRAKPEIAGRVLRLTLDGQTLEVTAGQDGAWSVEDASRPREKFDSPNPGVTRVAFTCPLRDGKLSFAWRSAVSMRTARLHVQMDLDDRHRMDLNEFYGRMLRTGADAVQVAPNMRLDMPTPERRKRMLDILAETLAFFRERNVPTTVWSNTLGYGGDLPKYLRGRFEGSARVSTAKGQVGADVFCPTDEALFRQVLRNARDFAAAGATAIQWDDDLFSSRAAPCCVCSNHLLRIAKILGRKVTAEEAEKAFAGQPNDVRRAVLRASGEAMMDFARRLRAELDRTAPHVDMTFCLSNPLWDVEGLDVIAFAGALQAKDRRERFFRLSGASYWPFLDWGSRYPGMDLGSVMEFLRVQSSWVRDRPDVVAIDENDTYPRRTKEVPAWAFSLYDKVIAADGGVRRNPYMLRTDPYGFDPAYADVFEREMPATERLVALFAKTVRYGVRVLYPQRQIAEADVATGRQGLEALYSMPIAADFLSRLGVPTKFDGADEEGPVAAFDSVAARVSPAELRRGVITDRRGAQLLEARGVETGVKAMPADALCFTHANAAGERFAVFNCDLRDFDFAKPSAPAMRAAAAEALAFLGSGKLLRVESDARVYHVFARNPRDGSVAVLLGNLSDREAEVRIVAGGSVLERVKLSAHGDSTVCVNVNSRKEN